MSRVDPFTTKRLKNFITDHRARSGQLPTLRDLRENGISEDIVKAAIKDGVIEELYVTMTSGAVVKGYVLK